MITEHKIKVNRVNALSSTGPKTRLGRTRSAKNALRHGLSLPTTGDPVLHEQAAARARRIAGSSATAYITTLALRIAEAEIDLRRARAARHRFLSQRLGDSNYRGPVKISIKSVNSLRRLKALRAAVVPKVAARPLTREEKVATIMLQEADRLLRFDRYERRARSRLKFAVRDFDEARVVLGFYSHLYT